MNSISKAKNEKFACKKIQKQKNEKFACEGNRKNGKKITFSVSHEGEWYRGVLISVFLV